MRGPDKQQVTVLIQATPDKRVPADHPLRRITVLADQPEVPFGAGCCHA